MLEQVLIKTRKMRLTGRNRQTMSDFDWFVCICGESKINNLLPLNTKSSLFNHLDLHNSCSAVCLPKVMLRKKGPNWIDFTQTCLGSSPS